MRILFVQPDDELANAMATEMDELGFSPVRVTTDDPDDVRNLAEERPGALLICLDSEADAALELATGLSARRRLRGVPLVFSGGHEAALNLAQERFPRANFSRRDVVYNVLSSLRP